MMTIRKNYVSIMTFFLTAALAYVFMIEPKYALFLSFLFLLGLLFIKRPEIAIIIGLFVSLDLIPGREILPIRGGMRPIFLVVLILFAGIFLLEIFGSRTVHLPRTPLNALVLLFLVLIVFSVFVAHYRFSIPLIESLKASCFWYSLAFFFFITGTIKTKEQIKVLINFLIVFATISAFLSVLQWISGSTEPIVPYMFAIRQQGDTLRIVGVLTPIAIVWPIFLADIILNKLSFRKTVFYIFEFVLFGLAFMIQMTRAFWVAIAISLGLVLAAGSISRKGRQTLVAKVAAIALFFVLGWLITDLVLENREEVFAPYINRFATINSIEKLVDASTFQGRLLENADATKLIKKYPLTGIGFGNMLLSITSEGQSCFGIHNNYYFIAGVMGFPGLIVYLLIAVVVVLRSYGNYRRIKDPYLICVFWGNSAFFLARLVQGWSTGNIGGTLLAYFALVIGVNEIIIRLNNMQISGADQPVIKLNSKSLRAQDVRHLRNI